MGQPKDFPAYPITFGGGEVVSLDILHNQNFNNQ